MKGISLETPLKAIVDEIGNKEKEAVKQDEKTILVSPVPGEEYQVIITKNTKNEAPVVKSDLP